MHILWAAAVQSGAEWFESMSQPVRLRLAHGAKPGNCIGGYICKQKEGDIYVIAAA